MSLTTQKYFALVIILLAAITGAGSFSAFLFFLYEGPLGWIPLGMKEAQRLVFDTFISIAFFLQHSFMVRRSFRRRVGALIPSCYQGAVYTLASGFVLLLLVVFWQRSDIIVFKIDGLPGNAVRALYFLSILGICWGMRALRSIDRFGLDAIVKSLQSKPSLCGPLRVLGPYRWVRHPLYLFMIVMFWSNPLLTADRLLFNILWTVWVVVGTVLEERDLVEDFGNAYRNYQSNVPMLVPHSFLPVYPDSKSNDGS